MQVSAMRGRGWSITAISKHLGRDRKTVRSYLEREERGELYQRAKPNKPDLFEPYLGYLKSRFSEDPHVVGTALYDEIVELGYGQSYSSFTRNLRQRELRPKCLSCLGVKSRYTLRSTIHPVRRSSSTSQSFQVLHLAQRPLC